MTRTRTPRRGGQTGLTLIEVLVSLILPVSYTHLTLPTIYPV